MRPWLLELRGRAHRVTALALFEHLLASGDEVVLRRSGTAASNDGKNAEKLTHGHDVPLPGS
jgi:hypothetical protein